MTALGVRNEARLGGRAWPTDGGIRVCAGVLKGVVEDLDDRCGCDIECLWEYDGRGLVSMVTGRVLLLSLEGWDEGELLRCRYLLESMMRRA